MNTCDKCKHYTPSTWTDKIEWKNMGECSLTLDSNDFDRGNIFPEDGCGGWDAESYRAGVFVGPKFGCIKWEAK